MGEEKWQQAKPNRVIRKAPGTRRVGFTVNGQYHQFNVGSETGEISPTHTLSWTLRETLGLTGTKVSCDQGACGCCTVIMDGKAVLSCKVLTIECDGKTITTIEGLRDPKTGALDPLQQSFIDHTAFQCGYCTPGMIMTAKAFLERKPAAHGRRGKRSSFRQFLQVHKPLPGDQGCHVGRREGEVSMGDTYRYIGKPMQRRDAAEIVTGAALYLDDLKFQNLLHGKVLRSPHAHALIKKIDKSKAEALSGVKAVLTWENVPDWRGGTPRNVPVLGKKVRYVGDAVALVAATTEQIAEDALDLIDVEYEVLPAVFDIDSALKPGAPLVYDEFPGNIIPGGTIAFGPNCLKGVVMGDVEKGFAEADVTSEGTFGYENIPNALPPESVGAVAMWEEPNKVTVWGTSQAPYMDKMTLSYVFNRQVDVRCVGSHVGGSFGTKIM